MCNKSAENEMVGTGEEAFFFKKKKKKKKNRTEQIFYMETSMSED